MEKTIRRKVNTVIMKLGRNATCNLTWANGRLSNFDAVASYFSDKGYKIVIPDLPIYTQNILKNVKVSLNTSRTLSLLKGLTE
jgi:hypothetical protein